MVTSMGGGKDGGRKVGLPLTTRQKKPNAVLISIRKAKGGKRVRRKAARVKKRLKKLGGGLGTLGNATERTMKSLQRTGSAFSTWGGGVVWGGWGWALVGVVGGWGGGGCGG